jgi:hypothetical protein
VFKVDDPLISISEAARNVGINKSTLSRQVKSGAIRSYDGLVRLSEVLEDRANNIDASIWANRGKARAPDALHATPLALAPLHATPEDDGDDDEAEVVIDGGSMPLGKAKALKETYLARLRRLEFEVKSGRLVDADAAKKAVFDLSRQDRDSWANWPSRVAPLIAAELGVDLVNLAVILEKHVREQLAERAQPALRIAS